MKTNTTDSRKLNDFVFEILPREEESESKETRSDFILRSGEKEIKAYLYRVEFDVISFECASRLKLDFSAVFSPVYNKKNDTFHIGMTSINIKTLDGNNTIEIYLYVIGNLKEDLILGRQNCWDLGLKDFFKPVLSCPEDNEDL